MKYICFLADDFNAKDISFPPTAILKVAIISRWDEIKEFFFSNQKNMTNFNLKIEIKK